MRSLSFPSVSCIPVLALKSWTTHKQPQAEKRQSLLSLAKGPGKGAAEKDRKLLDSMHSVAAKHPRKRCDPTHPLTTKAQRDPRGPPSPGCNKAPFPPAGDVTGSSVESDEEAFLQSSALNQEKSCLVTELFLLQRAGWSVPHLLQVLRRIWQEPEKQGSFLYGSRRSEPGKQILLQLRQILL